MGTLVVVVGIIIAACMIVAPIIQHHDACMPMDDKAILMDQLANRVGLDRYVVIYRKDHIDLKGYKGGVEWKGRLSYAYSADIIVSDMGSALVNYIPYQQIELYGEVLFK